MASNEQKIVWPEGFKCVNGGSGEEQVLYVDIKNRHELKMWLREYSDINPVRWHCEAGYYKLKNGSKVFRHRCCHANLGQTGARVTNTK